MPIAEKPDGISFTDNCDMSEKVWMCPIMDVSEFPGAAAVPPAPAPAVPAPAPAAADPPAPAATEAAVEAATALAVEVTTDTVTQGLVVHSLVRSLSLDLKEALLH